MGLVVVVEHSVADNVMYIISRGKPPPLVVQHQHEFVEYTIVQKLVTDVSWWHVM